MYSRIENFGYMERERRNKKKRHVVVVVGL